MKKVIIIMLIILGIKYLNNNQSELIIPEEAIRFRVIANSNDEKDQNTKVLVRNTIQKQLTNDLSKAHNQENAKQILKNNIYSYENIVENTLKNNNIKMEYKVNYGMNYFPEKIYKGIKYEEGYYESLVITLGNGMGNNWWCVLFPPLCLLEAEETEEKTEVEYKFFIKEIIDKYLK